MFVYVILIDLFHISFIFSLWYVSEKYSKLKSYHKIEKLYEITNFDFELTIFFLLTGLALTIGNLVLCYKLEIWVSSIPILFGISTTQICIIFYNLATQYNEFYLRKSLTHMSIQFNLNYHKYYRLFKENNVDIFPIIQFESWLREAIKKDSKTEKTELIEKIFNDIETSILKATEMAKWRKTFIEHTRSRANVKFLKLSLTPKG